MNCRIFSRLALITLVVAVCGCANPAPQHDSVADEYVAVQGKVHTHEGVGIENCMVSSSGRTEENAIITDENGKFEIDVRPGKQTFKIICPSVSSKSVTHTLTVDSKKSETLDFVM